MFGAFCRHCGAWSYGYVDHRKKHKVLPADSRADDDARSLHGRQDDEFEEGQAYN